MRWNEIHAKIHIDLFKKELENKELNPLFKNAFKHSIVAMGKQIPKKVTKIEEEYVVYGYFNNDEPMQSLKVTGQCPNCSGEIKNYELYCYHCGQKLDWDVE